MSIGQDYPGAFGAKGPRAVQVGCPGVLSTEGVLAGPLKLEEVPGGAGALCTWVTSAGHLELEWCKPGVLQGALCPCHLGETAGAVGELTRGGPVYTVTAQLGLV